MSKSVSFGEAISLFFKNYTNFSDRSCRSEFWWIVLFNVIISAVLSIIAKAVPALSILSAIYSLATLIPGLALSVRRLHDVGKSGWFLLIGLIPLVGLIILLVQFLKDSIPAETAAN